MFLNSYLIMSLLALSRLAVLRSSFLSLTSKYSVSARAQAGINFNSALDKEHETKTLEEIVELPVSALQGLTDKHGTFLSETFKINSIKDLAKWQPFQVAKTIVSATKYCEGEG